MRSIAAFLLIAGWAATAVASHSVTTSVVPNACNGDCNASATANVTGGSGNFTYVWSPSGQTTQTATNLCAGTYLVVVTDTVNGDQIPAFATVSDPPPLVIFFSNTPATCNGASDGSSSATAAGGTPPYTYLWTPGNTTGSSITNQPSGTYTLTVTDANGCSTTQTTVISQPAAIAPNGTTFAASCNGASDGGASVNPTGGTPPYTIAWSTGEPSPSIVNKPAGTYQVTITDANGCQASQQLVITQPSAVSGSTVVTDPTCFGLTNGSINLTPSGGLAPYTFDWGGGVTTEDRPGIGAGTYTVVITDANGCTGSVTVTVTEPAAVSGTALVTNVSCFGGSNGAIDITPTGGTPPYTFNWGGGITSEDRIGLAVGTYTVVITDANGCTGSVTRSITQPVSAVSGTTVVTNASCFGATNGSINLTPTGGVAPYTFNWGGGVTTEDRPGVGAGSYTVVITDANGCTGSVTATVTEPAAVSGTALVTNVSCFGGSNGAIDITPTGGTPPYTFNWGGGITSEDRTGLAAGTYTVLITDANGCTGSVTRNITQPVSAVSGTTVVTNASCFGATNGSINLTPTGGTAPYTFNWNGGVTSEDRADVGAGSYTVVISDSNGCTGSVTAVVNEPTALAASAAITNVSCAGGANGAIDLTPSGGTAPFAFNWGSGITTEDRTTLGAGTYNVTITDANGCSIARTYTVTAPAPLQANGSATGVTATGVCDGTAAVAPTGGTAPYSIVWSPGGATTATVTGLCGPTATATITDANGCAVTYVATITIPTSDLSITITGAPAQAQAGASIVYSIVASTTTVAPNATISGAIPAGTTFQSLTAPSGWTCTLPVPSGGGTYSCSTATMSAASSAPFQLTIGVPATFGAGTVQTTVAVSAAVFDGVPANDTATATTAITAFPANIPLLDARALLLLAATLGVIAAGRMRG